MGNDLKGNRANIPVIVLRFPVFANIFRRDKVSDFVLINIISESVSIRKAILVSY